MFTDYEADVEETTEILDEQELTARVDKWLTEKGHPGVKPNTHAKVVDFIVKKIVIHENSVYDDCSFNMALYSYLNKTKN